MHHDFKIQGQGNIFYINQVIFHSFNHFINVFCVTELYHPPGSDPWFYFKQVFEIGSNLQDAADIELPFRSWADQAHLTPDDIQ